MSLAALTYLDRVCISLVAPQIMRDLHLTKMQMSYVFSAFTLAYALFEIPTAWWADRIGSRRVLTRIVLWWSVFTMLTAGVFNYAVLLVVRFLFGAGEAGAWPNAARVFASWIPAKERGRVQGVFFASAHLCGGLTPLLVAYLMNFLPWRFIFLLFGGIGVFWALLWYRWFRDEPHQHAAVSPAERTLIESTRNIPSSHNGSWKSVFRTPGILPLCLQYFANTYGFYFFITWLPGYLSQSRGLARVELAVFAGMPLLFSVVADVTGGVATDLLSRRFGRWVGRCGISAIAYLLAAGAIWAGTLAKDGHMAGFLIALGGAASMFTLAPSWAIAVELGGSDAALLSAVMNTAGQIGGMLSPIALTYLLEHLNNWNSPLHVLAGLYLMAAVCWVMIQPGSPFIAAARS